MRISDWSSDVCSSDLALAVSRTVALGPFTTMLRELSHAFPGLQLQLRRGTGAEVTEYLKQGTAELAIAGPLDEPWSRLDAFPLFEEPFHLVVNRTHRLADRSRVEFSDLASDTLLITPECEMVEELKACLEAHDIFETAPHPVATQEELQIGR